MDGQMEAKRFPGILPAIGWIVAYFALQLAVSFVALIVASALNRELPQKLQDPAFRENTAEMMKYIAVPSLWGLFAAGLLLLGLVWFYIGKKDRPAQLGLTHWGTLPLAKTLGIGLAMVGVALAVQFAGSYALTEWKGPDFDPQALTTALLKAIPHTAFYQTLLFLTVAVLAPIVEEILFRGLLQRALQNVLPPAAAIAIASIIFGFVHMEPYAFVPLAILGAAMGYLYYRTGSLRTNIALHVLNNAAATLLLGAG